MLDGVETFVAVAETGGFSTAARRLERSSSFVSKEIARLEARLGVRLFHRTTRAVTLTDVGRAYFERCRPIVEQAQSAAESVMQSQETPRGRLKISVPVSLGLGLVARVIPEFLDANPEVTLDVELSDSPADIVSGGYDLALRVGDLAESRLVSRRVGAMRGLVVASPAFWKRHGRPRHPRDLAGLDCISYSLAGNPDSWRFVDGAGQHLDVTVVPRIVTNNAEMESLLAIAGQGVARIPDFACREALEQNQLEPVLDAFTKATRGIHIVFPHRQHLAAKTRAFIDFLADRFDRGQLTSAQA